MKTITVKRKIKNAIKNIALQPLVTMRHQKHSLRTAKKLYSQIPDEIRTYSRSDPIEVLKLPTRFEDALKFSRVSTVGKFYKRRRKRLIKIRSLGPKSVRYLMKFKRYIRLSDSEPTVQNPHSAFGESPMYKEIIVPYYVSRRDLIETLGFPIRLENILKNHDIRTVGGLFDISQKDLLKMTNMGVKSAFFLAHVKDKLIFTSAQSEETSNPQVVNDMQSIEKMNIPKIPNETLIDMIVERCGNLRAMEIIQRRYGLINGEKETLEEIGESFDITRERVRQIQMKSIKKMRHPSSQARRPIIELIDKILWENAGIISGEEADRLLPNIFKKLPYDGSSLMDLFADLGWIQSRRIGDMSFYAPKINRFKLIDFMEDIFELLKKSAEPLSPTSILNKLPPIKEIWDDRLNLLNLITKNCSLDPRIETKIAGKFSTYRMTEYVVNLWIPLMIKVLEEAQTPLYYTEIADRVNDKVISSNRHLEPRRAHSLLIEGSSFAHIGIRGTYGLVKWGLRKESTAELALECIKKAGFPLHWEQIYNYISRFKDSPKMNIRSILDQSGKFEKKGKGFYGIKE